MKRILSFVTIILVLCLGTCALAEPAALSLKLDSYDVALVDLDEPITLAVNGKSVTYKQGYLVRLHGRFPKDRALDMELYFGDQKIEEYGGLKNGIYFIVFTPERLKALSGKPIRYRVGKTEGEFGQTFAPDRFAPFTPIRQIDALTRE